MQLSKHFFRSEFACRCGKCGFDTVDYRLLEILEALRELIAEPITINSAARCLEHNRAIGSTDKSQHTKGRAADIAALTVSPVALFEYLDSLFGDEIGLGLYDTFVHVDTRGHKSRW